jgi:hypothetical protein
MAGMASLCRPRVLAVAVALAVACLVTTTSAQNGPRFYPDDPLQQEPSSQDASGAESWDIELATDLLLNLFTRPGDPAHYVEAQNINTIGEIPDSTWFTNRIYAREVSLEEIARGPNDGQGPAPGRFTITSAKTSGVSPGFTMKDSSGGTWFVQFDAKGRPRAATGAVMVAVRLFWALGYNQVESHLWQMDPAQMDIGSTAQVETRPGHERPMKRSDIDKLLTRAQQDADGTYRSFAGRRIQGKVLGGFRYYGTRPDDPNDVFPHEHRRELRALKVFGAWTNLVDMKAGNTLDSLIQADDGKSIVKHYLQDVGSTFGTGALAPREWDEGYEYLYEGDLVWKRLISLGFYLQPWQTIPYHDMPEVGRFEGDRFVPEDWKPRVPTAAFRRARPDDTFWAALRVAAFTDDQIRTAVKAARFEDPAAEQLLGDVLIKRRDKIAKAYLPKVNPLTMLALSGAGELTFVNAAVRYAGEEAPAGGYEATWERFDNATGSTSDIGTTPATKSESLKAPAGLPAAAGAFVRVGIRASGPPHEIWAEPLQAYFRKDAGGWTLVGIDRPIPPAPPPPK